MALRTTTFPETTSFPPYFAPVMVSPVQDLKVSSRGAKPAIARYRRPARIAPSVNEPLMALYEHDRCRLSSIVKFWSGVQGEAMPSRQLRQEGR